MIRSRSTDGLTLQVVVYAGRDQRTGKERYLRETVRGATAAKTMKAAQAAERRLKLQVDDRRHITSTATVDDLLDAWLTWAAPNLSPRTVSGYRGHIKLHIHPQLGHLEIAKLTTARLDRHYAELQAGGLAPMTVRHVHAILRRALGLAVRWQWIPTNPAAVEGTAPKVTPRRIEPPAADDARRLLDAAVAADPDFGILVALGLATGARRGELCGLRWSRVDLDHGVITIDETVIEVDHQLHVKGTKSGKARRVALDNQTVSLLRAHRSWALERALAGGVPFADDAYVASHSLDSSMPLKPDSFGQRWRRLARRLGVTARLHDLRHFHATQLLDAGQSLAAVSERLGHADPSITAAIYTHAVPEADRRAADAIGGVLYAGGAPGG